MPYPLPEQNPVVERVARDAVGSSLLFRLSPGGGSSGYGIDERRAADIAKGGIDGDALYELLLDVARRAADEVEREVVWAKRRMLEGASAVAEKSDSLTLHRFVGQLAAEVEQRDEQRRANTDEEAAA
ncbi:hypothetical protein [Curtobacterium sp. MCSS17_016]|uniref:hypothetical protein n=1 Tax=Curtobacterium sp. MCSS17_016 TaxID=2175644 RepID=UPI000DA89DCE|nr:hypothetical protein [Curtobacterium sp. MCSS17_016]WIE81252.1 hypothetical protein DEJ19_018635 [Curtobacterium sp. MCSS17_016]